MMMNFRIFSHYFGCGTKFIYFMRSVFPFTVFLFIVFHYQLTAQGPGEQLFKTTCASCHTINKGRLVGPDLTKVYEKRSNEWLISFIRSSQSMVKAGDPDAVAIYNEYARIPMPDNQFTDEQILSIIDYIRTVDQGSGAAQEAGQPADTIAMAQDSTMAVADTTTFVFTYEIVQRGDSLYNGLASFSTAAVPCMSCHNIMGQSFLGGGKLAFDLTRSYTKLGHAGIQAILMNPPFPAMKAAMPGRLSDEEVTSLIALLKNTNDRFAVGTSRSMGGLSFFIIAFVIAILLTGHVFLFYDNRRIPDKSPGNSGNKNYIK